MALQLGDTAPDFEAETTEGPIRFHEWLGDSWAVMFSHPKDFTPVCTTELGYMAKIKPEFDKRGVKLIGLSVDPVEMHKKWMADIKDGQTLTFTYVPDKGVQVHVKGAYKGTIQGADFAQVFISIWLGPHPPNKGLKKGMLGKG